MDKNKLELIDIPQVAHTINSSVLGYRLHIISEETPNIGDWYFNFENESMQKFIDESQTYIVERDGGKKIIASNTILLKSDWIYKHNVVPLVSDESALLLISELNAKGIDSNLITIDILVEYEGDYDEYYEAWYADTICLKI